MSKRKKSQNSKPEFKPIIGVPLERNIPYADEVFWSFIAIAQQGYPFIKLPYTRVDVARNKFAEHLLNSDFTHLIMLDLDQKHPSDLVEKFKARIVEDPTRLVISGLYFRRGKPYDPLAFVYEDGNVYALANWNPGELHKVDAVGTGIICIAREVFEIIPQPWFYYDYSGIAVGAWPTEDIAFCKKCNDYNIDIWLDTAITSDHMINGKINEEVFRSYVNQFGDEHEPN